MNSPAQHLSSSGRDKARQKCTHGFSLTKINTVCQNIIDAPYPSELCLPHPRQVQCPQRKLRGTRREIAGAAVELVEPFSQEIAEVMGEPGLLSDNLLWLQLQCARLRSHSSRTPGRMAHVPGHKEAEQPHYPHREVEKVEGARSPVLLKSPPRAHLRSLGEIH